MRLASLFISELPELGGLIAFVVYILWVGRGHVPPIFTTLRGLKTSLWDV